MSILLSLFFGLAMQGTASTQPGPPLQESANPAVVFRQVCLEGGATFGRDAATPTALEDLPQGLRTALDGYAAHADLPEPFRRYGRLGAERIPNSFFRLGSFRAYLMAPRQDAVPKSTGRHCAVFWRGDHWAELRATLGPWMSVSDPAAPRRAFMGWVAVRNTFSGHIITLANFRGWTMMRTMPAENPELAEPAD